ncbi:hypothetical protein TSUD_395580 [Trifolium subterraneum]|uniref:RNase H type-1 domain-containing protein n=1 Tax=Trifolium subterraneum TaxID=3900 RepID=A0A2Z6NNX8_TRISU|nr:hypothetical protein TSUD_395580 [Trifolium subterraneum]
MLRAKYLQHQPFINAPIQSGSPIWNSISKAKMILADGFKYRVSDGSSLFCFNNQDFFSNLDVYDWLKLGAIGPHALTFAASVWWSWRHRNLMCLNNETWSLNRISFNIRAMVETTRNCFSPASNVGLVDRYIKWNNNNYSCVILNGFSGFISGSSDILLAELYAIYKGLLLAKDMSIDELVCYSDSLHCVNLIKGPQVKYHIHAVLIQDIKDRLSQISVSLHHTLREGNQCADFFAKLGASSDFDFLTHTSPPEGIRDLLRNDPMGTLFIHE